MTISEPLGEVDLGDARIRYRDRGEGPPVVFVHGLLMLRGAENAEE